MIKKLAKLKYWEIAALGVSLAVIGNLLVMFAVRFIVGTWPQANEAGHIAYVIITAFLSWTIIGVFVEAINQKNREALVEEALDTISDLYASFKISPSPEYHGSYVDESGTYGSTNLDELAEELGLAPEKEAKRG